MEKHNPGQEKIDLLCRPFRTGIDVVTSSEDPLWYKPHYEELTEGISWIDYRIPGCTISVLAVFGESAFPVATSSSGEVVIAAALYENVSGGGGGFEAVNSMAFQAQQKYLQHTWPLIFLNGQKEMKLKISCLTGAKLKWKGAV